MLTNVQKATIALLSECAKAKKGKFPLDQFTPYETCVNEGERFTCLVPVCWGVTDWKMQEGPLCANCTSYCSVPVPRKHKMPRTLILVSPCANCVGTECLDFTWGLPMGDQHLGKRLKKLVAAKDLYQDPIAWLQWQLGGIVSVAGHANPDYLTSWVERIEQFLDNYRPACDKASDLEWWEKMVSSWRGVLASHKAMIARIVKESQDVEKEW